MGAGVADTTITSIISDTQFVVGDPGDIGANDVIKIDVTSPSNPSYGFEQRRVSSITGNTITLTSSVTTGMYEGSVVQAGSWYYGGGPSVSKVYSPLYIYDPVDLANSVTNPTLYPPTDVTPVHNSNFAFPNFSYPLPGVFTGSNPAVSPRGIAFDKQTNRLYLATYDIGGVNNIFVYQLNAMLPNAQSNKTPWRIGGSALNWTAN